MWRRVDRVRPLLAWRDAELAVVAQAIREVLQGWREAWGLCGEPPAVHCAPTTTTEHALPWRLAGSDDDATAWLALVPAFELQLTRTLWGLDDVAGPLARRVLGGCRDDLAARLLTAMNMTPAHGAIAQPPASFSPWSGQVTVAFEGEARLLLDGAAVTSVLHAAAPGSARAAAPVRESLSPIPAAVADLRLPLQARLGDCELDVASLQDLRVGDIVPLRHRLDEPLHVRDAGNQLVFDGFLARQGQRKALELAAPATHGAPRA